MFHRSFVHGIAAACIVTGFAPVAVAAGPNSEAAARAAYWTKERRAAAIPRDLRIDARGLGYLRRPDGKLVPHGHQIAAEGQPTPQARPPGGGGGDSAGPTVTGMTPAANATIGASATFSATVTDASGVRSVSVVIHLPSGQTQSFAAAQGANSVWSANISGFTDGSDWAWHVVAKDLAGKGGNTTTSAVLDFNVDTGGGGGGGGGGGTVTNEPWTQGGAVQTAAGRIYFEMPANARKTKWNGYVCSGTVADDGGAGDRSVIITAAHCVYDDANKAFARNVLFIPNQDGTTGAGTDLNCSNDPLGCWSPAYGVVDVDWTTRTFPNNVAWDYAYYVVDNSGAHSGNGGGSSVVLDTAAGSMSVDFSAPDVGGLTHALGYSYSDDPNFMYCAEEMEIESGGDDWWLPSCDLSGGSSGGPWVQPMNEGTGNGPIISVNSWGYTTSPGMAGPFLTGTSAQCIFNQARVTLPLAPPSTADGNEGYVISDGTCNQPP